jgi:hypothetical protein
VVVARINRKVRRDIDVGSTSKPQNSSMLGWNLIAQPAAKWQQVHMTSFFVLCYSVEPIAYSKISWSGKPVMHSSYKYEPYMYMNNVND